MSTILSNPQDIAAIEQNPIAVSTYNIPPISIPTPITLNNAVYYQFISGTNFTGTYSTTGTTLYLPQGSICEPNDILKLNYSSSAWTLPISSVEMPLASTSFVISTLSGTDWDLSIKQQWLDDYYKFYNIYEFIINNPTYNSDILNYIESINLFEQLSGVSLAYANQSSTGEVILGINSYPINFIFDYVQTLPNGDLLKNYVYVNGRLDGNYISHAMRINYKNISKIVYGFGGIEYNYKLSHLPTLNTGGGNIFTEIRFAGNGLKAHYKVVKNPNIYDPTLGYCSGDSAPFCIGDYIVLVEDGCWTDSDNNDWTWIGDYSQLQYTWDIADITDPCNYYKDTPIHEMLFPFRAIQDCRFDDFN